MHSFSFYFLLCVHVCVCMYLCGMCTCIWRYACICVHTQVEARVQHWGSSSIAHHFIFWKKGLSLNLEPAHTASLADQPALGILLSVPPCPAPHPVLGLKTCTTVHVFYMGAEETIFSPHSCMASTLTSNPSPCP